VRTVSQYVITNSDQPQLLLSLRIFIGMDSCLPTSVRSFVVESRAASRPTVTFLWRRSVRCPTSLSTFGTFCNKSYSDAPAAVAMQNKNLAKRTENPEVVVALLDYHLACG